MVSQAEPKGFQSLVSIINSICFREGMGPFKPLSSHSLTATPSIATGPLRPDYQIFGVRKLKPEITVFS